MPDSDEPDNISRPGRRIFVQGAAIAGAAMLTADAHAQRGAAAMADDMTAEDVRKLLDLTPNATCGYVRLTYVSKQRIAPGGLPVPFAEGRPMGSALYFMLTPDEPVKLHRIRNDQLYHYYVGDPIEVLMLLADGTNELHVVGPDLRRGQKVQLFIPGNTFHTARVIGGRGWFLGGSTEWPGVEPIDVELGNAEALAARYPGVAAEIRSFPRPAPR
jgi:predicted cupin superfamily sugar epimerase